MRTLLFAALALVFMLTFGGPALGQGCPNGPCPNGNGPSNGCSFDCSPDGWAAVIINTDGVVSATGITCGVSDGYTNISGAGLVLQPGYCGFESYNSHSEFDHDYTGVAMTSAANGGVLAMSGGYGDNVAGGDGNTTARISGTITLPGLYGTGSSVSIVNVCGTANTN